MSESCSHNCSSCSQGDCADRENKKESFLEKPNELSKIKKVIGVVSGKGGVGKSLITSLLATEMNKLGYNSAILDADITGPSIPKAFGVTEAVQGSELGAFPAKSEKGVEIMSLNLLLQDETDPVIWRGPVIAGAVKQFWTDIIWSDVDYMFVDMPPGTGDVPLTVFQSIPLDGIVIATSPQKLVGMIVEKAVKMAHMMEIPVLGIVENMSYFKCDNCDKEHYIFGESRIDSVAVKHGIPLTAKIPMDSKMAEACDSGNIENYENSYLSDFAKTLTEFLG